MKGVTSMSGTSEEKKTVYRLAPCPAYDVEGMESWLSDLAEEGLFLTQDGFFCGFGFFYEDVPRKAKYRLQASEFQGGFLSDHDEPEEEEKELSEALGWEYVARRGEFYIYRSINENVRELNTDPEVQALTLKIVQKRQFSSLISCVLWMVVYPFIRHSKKALIAPMLYMKNWFYLFSMVLILCFFIGAIKQLVYYTGLRKRLQCGEQPDRNKKWKKRSWLYPAKVMGKTILCIIWGCIVLANLGRDVLFENEIPLAEYRGNPPFATIADFEQGHLYELIPMGYSNTVVEWSDWLAPVNFLWDECGEVMVSEEKVLSGLLMVDYHELKFEWLAKLLAADYYRMDQDRDFEFLYELDLGIDYAVAYLDNIHMPTVVLRNGTKVLHATFHEYSESSERKLAIEEWAAVLAESLK